MQAILTRGKEFTYTNLEELEAIVKDIARCSSINEGMVVRIELLGRKAADDPLGQEGKVSVNWKA